MWWCSDQWELRSNRRADQCNDWCDPTEKWFLISFVQYFIVVTILSLCHLSPFSDFLILPGFIDFTSDEVVSVIILSNILNIAYCSNFLSVLLMWCDVVGIRVLQHGLCHNTSCYNPCEVAALVNGNTGIVSFENCHEQSELSVLQTRCPLTHYILYCCY